MSKKDFSLSLHEQIRKNRYRTAYLFISFPILIIILTFIALLIVNAYAGEIHPLLAASQMISTVGFWVLLAVFGWSFISYFIGSKMILGFAGAKPIKKSDHKNLFNIVENISIAAGMQKAPDIYIINDQSLNAFATGRNPKTSKVAISKGLLEKLSKAELEAVMAHEIGHIINRDIRVMLISIAIVGAIEMIGEIIIRASFSNSSDNKKGGLIITLIGFLFILVGTTIASLTRLAISREREYLADGTSAYLTSNPDALSRALKKIAEDARIEILDKKASMAGLCIADPSASGHKNHTKALKTNLKTKEQKSPSLWQRVWSTHPPIADRIERLSSY